ncbi:hypothetical protein M0804_009596 [Polistes exclamans]|nr:hypothetical protein M0804_009596 [Polistes exclamans]
MLQSLNALAGKISPSSPTDSNANKVHMHNNNNVVHHHHPYSKQQTQPSLASHSSNNNDQKENTKINKHYNGSISYKPPRGMTTMWILTNAWILIRKLYFSKLEGTQTHNLFFPCDCCIYRVIQCP